MSICVPPYIPGVLAHNRCSKLFVEWMKEWPSGWINKRMNAAPWQIIPMGCIGVDATPIWCDLRRPSRGHTHTTRKPHQESQINIHLVRALRNRRGKERHKRWASNFQRMLSTPWPVRVCFLYEVFPITVALSVSGSISSEFLCSSCQTYGINQGFGAGALAAGMLTAWQTRGSGVMESPRVFGLNSGGGWEGGGER